MSEDIKDVVITALAEKTLRLEHDVEKLEHDVKLWQTVYHEKNARIAELEGRLIAAGSNNGGDSNE